MRCLCDLPKTDFHERKDNPVKELFTGYKNVVEASSFLYFEKDSVTQEIVHSIKYYGDKNLARYIGRLAAMELYPSKIYSSIDAIIPLPLHRKKERKRGYNQSEYISFGIADIYHKEIDNKSVMRTVYTESQTKKKMYERHINVENIFKAVDIQLLTGKHVLIIDDVITTGATVSACIDALSEVPNIKISVFSLAITGGG
jgi:ComF family protein